MNKSTQIDNLIFNQYSEKKYRELIALSKLFSTQFLNGLEKILNSGCRYEEHFKEVYDVSLGWIDKIPLASFVNNENDINGNLIKEKVEIGDFLLVYTHSLTYQNKEELVIQTSSNRAIVIQAKISNIRNPKIPIGPLLEAKVNSTSKELTLLSRWPEFDLYKTSASKKPELTNLKINPVGNYAKFAGFYKRQWDLGIPKYQDVCKESFGEIIENMINMKEGQTFNPDMSTTSNDWDKLINKMIGLCGEYSLPGYIFGKNKKRILQFNRLYFNPIFPLLLLFFRKKQKFPVLVINRIFYEGKINR